MHISILVYAIARMIGGKCVNEAGPLHRTHSPEEDVQTIKRWVRTTRGALENLNA